MTQNTTSRRNFLTLAATGGAGLLASKAFGQTSVSSPRPVASGNKKLQLRFYPYETQMQHVFTVASSSRTSTQGVQVEITYDGLTGYGEAAMPPYLGESIASVTEFLNRVDLEQFKSPFELESILTYVDGITENNTAAKASIDIALHDLVGKLLGAP